MIINLQMSRISTVMVSFVMLTITVEAGAQKTLDLIIPFDAPGAGLNSGQGTVPESVNSNGEITGQYYDEYDAVHGFVRAVDGTITTFDVPGASIENGQGTYPFSVNARGEITGFFYDASSPVIVTRSFVRDVDGFITTFGGGPNPGMIAVGINPKGEIAGATGATGSRYNQGFVRAPDGTITTFAASQFDTVPTSLNAKGEVTGWYDDASFAIHGFVRSTNGTIATFDAGPQLETVPESINSRGEITGSYYANGAYHGFVRSINGTIISFDVGTNTVPSSISESGKITGTYYEPNSLVHGFVRAANGSITKFDVPGAGERFFGDGTHPLSIDPGGEITGWYSDANGAYHGFVRIPAE